MLWGKKEGKICGADFPSVFIREGVERIKKYDAVKISADGAVKFKFLFSDMIFWGEEDAFTGSIED